METPKRSACRHAYVCVCTLARMCSTYWFGSVDLFAYSLVETVHVHKRLLDYLVISYLEGRGALEVEITDV